MGEPRSISLKPLPVRLVYLTRCSAREETNPPRSRRLRPPRKAIRDCAVLFLAIRPQTPFVSILPVSARRPTREQGQLGSQGLGAEQRAAPSNWEFQRTEKSDSRPASAAMRRLRRQAQPCKRCAVLIRRRNSSDSRSDLVPHGTNVFKSIWRSSPRVAGASAGSPTQSSTH